MLTVRTICKYSGMFLGETQIDENSFPAMFRDNLPRTIYIFSTSPQWSLRDPLQCLSFLRESDMSGYLVFIMQRFFNSTSTTTQQSRVENELPHLTIMNTSAQAETIQFLREQCEALEPSVKRALLNGFERVMSIFSKEEIRKYIPGALRKNLPKGLKIGSITLADCGVFFVKQLFEPEILQQFIDNSLPQSCSYTRQILLSKTNITKLGEVLAERMSKNANTDIQIARSYITGSNGLQRRKTSHNAKNYSEALHESVWLKHLDDEVERLEQSELLQPSKPAEPSGTIQVSAKNFNALLKTLEHVKPIPKPSEELVEKPEVKEVSQKQDAESITALMRNFLKNKGK